MKLLQSRALNLFLFLTLSTALLLLHQANRLQPVEDLALHFLSPLQSGFSSLAATFADGLQAVQGVGELRARNEELQSLVNSLMVENVRLREIEAENKILLSLLDFTLTHPDYEYKAAEVIGREATNLTRYVFLDVGERGGLKPGMPVVTERGLVGRITEVHSDVSRALLINDASSSVSALIQGSRATGVVEGSVEGKLLMKYLPQEESIEVGDIVITSGLGGNFPKRLVIGQVMEVHKKDVEMFQEAVLLPAVDFNKLEIVLVITNFQPIDFLNREWRLGNRE
ncbi:MAG: rod shape-determining protein MreC [Anaerolineae bacterium]